jgi:hypothetical protein
MDALLLEKAFPGATTAILAGGLEGVDPAFLTGYRHILWWTGPGGPSDAPALAGHPSLQAVPIDRLDPAALGETVESFLRRDARRLPSVYVTRGVEGEHAEAFRRVLGEVFSRIEQQHRARTTRQQDGFAWQSHLLRNAGAYSRHGIPGSWAGTLRGLPAFVVGAGPSLDLSAPVLARLADRAVVLAADSALRALARRGVAADFAVSIDVHKVPERCLPAEGPGPGRIVLSLVSPPAWTGALPSGRAAFASGRQVTEDWLVGLGVTRPAVAAKESCGSTALELALFLGCGPVYLFGMDLAVDAADPARRHHGEADPALYRASNYDPSASLPRVPGNYAESVPCFALGDWRELDARLAGRTQPPIYNVNDRGARLRGTVLVHPDRFGLEAPPGPKSARLAAMPPAEQGPGVPAEALARLRSGGRRAADDAGRLRIALERGGPQALAEAFRQALSDAEIARLLGAFSLKLMPHLFPPIEGDASTWGVLLAEYTELARLAADPG